MAAADLITFDELRGKVAELDDICRTAESELRVLREREAHLDELEKNRDRLLDSLADVVPEALDSLTFQERNQVYKMLRLRVVANLDGSLEISGAFEGCFVLQDASQGVRWGQAGLDERRISR